MAFKSQRAVPGNAAGSLPIRTQLENVLGDRPQYAADC
jgi:hypothetical protein